MAAAYQKKLRLQFAKKKQILRTTKSKII